MPTIEELKQEAVQRPGQVIRSGTVRIGYWRWGRGASSRDKPMHHFYRWDAQLQRHFSLTEAEAAALLDSEEED